ncbi:MAG: hypothetical protein GF353_00940 [Candidatus Lokiarchaeota archaeon]|nr:hypothetical protein [Candidatus Lokiarchaeota archaeon]
MVKTDETDDVFELDHTDNSIIIDNIIKPYILNQEFQIDGYFIEPSKVKRIMVCQTEHTSDVILDTAYNSLSEGVFIAFTKKGCIFEDDKYKNDITREIFEQVKEMIQKNKNNSTSTEIKKSSSKQKTIFIGYSYRIDDDEFVSGLKELLADKGYKIIDGKADRLGSISQAIIDKIKICDISIIVMTKRDKKENGKFTTTAWLLEEKGASLALKKNVAIFVEEEIDEADIGGLQGDSQRFHFTRNNFLKVAMNFVKILDSTE